jgi:outer membrane protein assembly factor BamE
MISPCFATISSMNLRLLPIILVAGCLIVALQGCLYRMDIPQGNRIDDGLEQQLEIGMSRNQVEFLLGSPAIIDLYKPDQWYYYYYLKTGDDGKIVKRNLTLTFTNNLLSKIEGTLSPG